MRVDRRSGPAASGSTGVPMSGGTSSTPGSSGNSSSGALLKELLELCLVVFSSLLSLLLIVLVILFVGYGLPFCNQILNLLPYYLMYHRLTIRSEPPHGATSPRPNSTVLCVCSVFFVDRVSCHVTPVTSCSSQMSYSSVLNSEVIRTVQHTPVVFICA
jgi:hypothetical protein